ncbi:hypothetical protein NLC36_05175, partial [Candidatus Aminicenantes bacterium AC-335-L06]|nr:hypothetical protein [Candidatus Aminicenantes bacterium AC-335-L06]
QKRELARIALRDLLNYGELSEITLELSQLADVLLENILEYCEQNLIKIFGYPQYYDSTGKLEQAKFTIIGLGKLGGEELNYSSDIDLLFIYTSEGQTSGQKIISTSIIENHEFFSKLASDIIKIISKHTKKGTLYRVDLRLRPNGRAGELVSSFEKAIGYYSNWASPLEKQSLIKARVCAGDEELGKNFLKEIEPVIYREGKRKKTFLEIKRTKDKIDLKLRKEGKTYLDIKLGYGGIREVEFLIQALQLFYGLDDKWIREKNSLLALTKLYDKGYLDFENYKFLMRAYCFLRKVEHILQIFQNLQTHCLPNKEGELLTLSRKLNFDSKEDFLHELNEIRDGIRAIYDSYFFEFSQEHLLPEKKKKKIEFKPKRLAHLFFEKVKVNEKEDLFLKIISYLKNFPNPKRGLKNFENFIEFSHSDKINSLFKNPSRLQSLLKLIGTSDLLAQLILRAKDFSFFDEEIPNNYYDYLSEKIKRGRTFLEKMNLARIFQQKEYIKLGLKEIENQINYIEVFKKLTELAESLIKISLKVALEQHHAKEPAFTILGLGNIGLKELDFRSDLDLIFVYKGKSAYIPDEITKIAKDVITFLSNYTKEGVLYPVDLRLRPAGKAGELVQTSDYLRYYFHQETSLWEEQAFLKTRFIAGNEELGNNIIKEIKQMILAKEDRELSGDILKMRQKIEEKTSNPLDFKNAAGGLMDVYFLLDYLILKGIISFNGEYDINLLFQEIENKNFMGNEDKKNLIKGYYFLKKLEHKLCILLDKNISYYPQGEINGKELAKDFGYPPSIATRLLLKDLKSCKDEIRRVFKKFLT